MLGHLCVRGGAASFWPIMMAVLITSPMAMFCASYSSSSTLHGSLAAPSPPHLLCRLRFSTFISSSTCFTPPLALPLPSFAARSMSGSSSGGQMDDLVKDKIAQNPVIVFSKTWCAYCATVKELFSELGVKPFIVELDQLADEDEVQRALRRLTGQSTIPNVFIGGKHIGGCDDTMELHQSGELIPLLRAAQVKFS